MISIAPFVVAPDEGRLGPFRILAVGDQTRGAYVALDCIARPAQLARPHLHLGASEAEDIATGERVIVAGGRELRAPAGSFVLVGPGVPHSMADPQGGSRWFQLFSPPDIERWLFERERMRVDGASADELDAASRRYDVRAADRAPGRFHVVIADAPASGRVLASGTETQGAYSVVEHTFPAAEHGPAMLTHDDVDEAVYIAEGTLELELDGREVTAEPGAFAFIPRGVKHSFTSLEGPARYITICSPAPQRARGKAAAS